MHVVSYRAKRMFASLDLPYHFQGKPESAFTDAREPERMSDGVKLCLIETTWMMQTGQRGLEMLSSVRLRGDGLSAGDTAYL